MNFVEWLVERLDFRLHQAANVPSTPVPTVTVYTQGKGAAGGEKGKGQPAEAAGGEKGKGKPEAAGGEKGGGKPAEATGEKRGKPAEATGGEEGGGKPAEATEKGGGKPGEATGGEKGGQPAEATGEASQQSQHKQRRKRQERVEVARGEAQRIPQGRGKQMQGRVVARKKQHQQREERVAGHLQVIHGLAGSGKERVAWHLQVVHGLAGEMVAWHLPVMHGGMTSAKASGRETGESGAGRKRRRRKVTRGQRSTKSPWRTWNRNLL